VTVIDRIVEGFPKSSYDPLVVAVAEHSAGTVKTILLEKADTLDSVNARTTARVLRGIVQEVFES
jgi:hypothetical protein